MSGLTDEDREALGWAIGNRCSHTGPIDEQAITGCSDCDLSLTEDVQPVVERIVTRHLEAAATAIEAAIDAYVTTAGLPTFIPTTTGDAERTGRLVGLSAAARIVRDHAP